MRLHRAISGIVLIVAATSSLECAKNDGSGGSTAIDTCKGRQALQSVGLRGVQMEPKTLALTFDDGPGPRTKALSAYLKNEGIQAAFFVNGASMDRVLDGPGILQQLVDDGHIIGNHTETHRSLTGVSEGTPRPADAEILKELEDTDAKIAPFIKDNRFLFRPPFGDFDDETLRALASSPMNKYVGPVLWDVGDTMDEANGRAADWDCWQDGSDGKRTPMQTCGDLYISEIKRANWGIVLLHDPYYNELDPEQAGTVEMVMYMVPLLKAEGFTFVRLDKVPEIAALLPPEQPGPGAQSTSDPPPATGAPPPEGGEPPCP